jgi:hypothetical protein
MSAFQATGFVDAAAGADRALVAIQGPPRPYRLPIRAYPGQDFGPILRRVPRSGLGADGGPLVPAVRLDLYTVEDGWFAIGNGLDGVVLTADRTIVSEMAMFSEPYRDRTGDVVLGTPDADAVFDDVFIGFDAAWMNWYHWLCFALGRSSLAANLLPASCNIILPDYISRASGTHIRFGIKAWRQSIAALGLDGRTRLLPAGLYRARKIRFFWTVPGEPTNITYLSLFQDAFTRAQRGLSIRPGVPRRILVSRESGLDPRADQRETDVLNAVAAAHGFTKICFERMDFRAQCDTVFNADYVFGLHGAGLANILFGKPDLRLLELNRPLDGGPLLRPWFYLLAHARGQRYSYLNGGAGDFSAERIAQAIRSLL